MDPLNVLMVDDDSNVGYMMKALLAKEAPHFSFHFVESAQECLEYIKSNKVDCILSDYQMPEMDGMELLLAIRAQGSNIPFIFVTGQGNEQVARDAFKNGADDYFTKDIGFAHFMRIVNSIRQSVKKRSLEHARLKADEALRENEARYRFFIANSSEAIWCIGFDTPIQIALPVDEQVRLIMERAYIAECNDAAAHLFWLGKAEDLTGARLMEVVLPGDQRNVENLRRFIRSGYRQLKGESYAKEMRSSNLVRLFNCSVGIVENGYLTRVWGESSAVE